MNNQDDFDDDFQLNTSTAAQKEKKAKNVQSNMQKKAVNRKSDQKIYKNDGLKNKIYTKVEDNKLSEKKKLSDRKHTVSTNFQPSKTAKFSSLFKNNHEIPKVGDIEAKETVKETVFSSNNFSTMDLHPHLADCLEKRFKLSKMTQIQEKSIPSIIEGRDCFLKSQTGSGKTLAYAIPIVQQLMIREPKIKRTDGIRALILVPTRELALQTCQVFEELCKSCIWIVPGCLIGGMKKKSEKDRIRRGLNILICTPGRLCDHLDTTLALDLSKLEYLIFDEADRMLDLDFEKKINFIIFKIHSARKKALAEPEIPKFKLDENGEPIEDESAKSNLGKSKRLEPQIILISATLTSGIKEIARRLNVSDALQITASNDAIEKVKEDNQHEEREDESEEKITLPSGLTHYYTIVPSKLRLVSLISFILEKFAYNKKSKVNKMVIFASTNDSVQFHDNILTTFLNRKFNMYLDEEDDKINYEDITEFDSDLEMDIKKSKNNSSQLEKTIKSKKNTVCDVFSLYGNMDQHKRAEILTQFCKAKSGILICTDVAARGLDMPNIDWIIQYNTPGSSVDYVHRVGRTARVGHKGYGIVFIEPCEIEYLKELNKLGITMHEMKLDSIMEPLMEESNFYPRQVNSDRLVYPKNVEECANSMQFYIEEYVEKLNEVQTLARKAYISFMRSYSTYSTELKKIFHIKNLHLGHVAKSFGLREAPKEIIQKESKLFKNNYNRKEERGDRMASRQARDLKRISNGHKEYGNVAKKNKINSQRTNLDLSGLLKNHKQVSEYSSGFEKTSNNKRTSSQMMSNGDRKFPKPENEVKRPKIIKKNMDIFD